MCSLSPPLTPTVARYTRNFDQNDELGLNDMKTEGYEQEEGNS